MAAHPSPPARTVLDPPGRKVVRIPVDVSAEVRAAGRRRRYVRSVTFLLIMVGLLLFGWHVGMPRGHRNDAAQPTGAHSTGAHSTGAHSTSAHSTSAHPRSAQPRSAQATSVQSSGASARSAVATTTAPPTDLIAAQSMAGTSGRFAYAKGAGPVLGSAGPIHRFRLAVEKPSQAGTVLDFARQVDRTLGDRRSWTAAGQFRLRRVPRSAYAEFTIYLASARTSRRMCAAGGLQTRGYTSCRLSGQVIINGDRWEQAVPDYGAPLEVYRAYAINHEVGHQLGHGHQRCPGVGRPAPVMMQQTYGLRGCLANPWPYLGGKRYNGPPTR